MATRKKAAIQVDEAEKCRNCRHYGADDGEKVCKRFPRVFVRIGDDVSLCYPIHKPDDECGEFKRRLQG